MKFSKFTILIIFVFLFSLSNLTLADAFDDAVDKLTDRFESLIEKDQTDQEVQLKINVTKRQIGVSESYKSIKERLNTIDKKDDDKKKGAEALLKDSEEPRDDFLKLTLDESIDYDLLEIKSSFTKAESDAISAINKVNRYILMPSRPGSDKNDPDAGVPEGDILEDFIPGLIRILFRFASLAVLTSFVTSGVFFIVSFGNDERLSKAKHMLYYSLIGFAFIVLAFAMVKAITDIDFFGFI